MITIHATGCWASGHWGKGITCGVGNRRYIEALAKGFIKAASARGRASATPMRYPGIDT